MTRPHSHATMPHPGIPIIQEAWKELTVAVFETKAYMWCLAVFSASTASLVYNAQQAEKALREVLYIHPFYLIMIGCIIAAGLVLRTFAYWIYYYPYKRNPPVKITAWMVSAWPSYCAWIVFMMFGANSAHRLWPPAQEFIMAAAVITILLVEVNMTFHFWFGDKDTLRGYLRRFGRVVSGMGRISKGDLDGAMQTLKDEVGEAGEQEA